MRLDLHLHSSASDGAVDPVQLVELAARGRLDVIALTDHDTTAGLAAALGAAQRRIDVIPGLELSTTFDGREVHMLGYFIDPESEELTRFSRHAATRRQARMSGMIERLSELGIAVHYDEVVRLAGAEANVGRPHLARVLVQRGHVRTFAEAFDRFIGDGGPAFLPVQLLTPERAIAMIHRAGGVAVWAHPPVDLFRTHLASLVEHGLDGVEAFRPRTSPAEVEALLAGAAGAALLVSGGSDWHGEWNGALGDFAVSADDVGAFLALRGF